MAIRLSTARLAAAVANEGGIGLIAASGMEEQELRTEIRLARKLTNGKGIIGINCMVAARAFKNLIVTAAQEGVDLIVAGAGFSRDIFAVGREYNVAVVPIVSSVKLAKISEKLGASAIVVEGTEAGGHLGTQQSIKEILQVEPPAGRILWICLIWALTACRWEAVLQPAKNLMALGS